MINLDGATLLFPTSFGYYSPHMVKMANKYPKLHFEHCGGLWTDKDPKNAGSYFGYIDEAQYISGIVAGYSTKTGKLGFVAAKPIPQVLRNINAFTLGARLANPKATTQVIFTGDWSMPVKEAEATNSLIDQGVDVLTCHVDGPKTMVENAARRGAMVCGYHANQSPLAPEGVSHRRGMELGSALSKVRQDEHLRPKASRTSTAAVCRKRSSRSRRTARRWSRARRASTPTRSRPSSWRRALAIFKGPLIDNKGKTVIAAGTDRGQKDPELEKMDYLVEGVIGATS